MSLLKIAVEKLLPSQKIEFGNHPVKPHFGVVLSYCTSNKSDIELNVEHISCFISVCPFGALSTATFAENVHIFFSCLVHIKKRSCLTSCVF